jgi:hypothetical protein
MSSVGGSRRSCKKGQIKRNSYRTKNGRVVKENCIIAQSNSGRKSSRENRQISLRRSASHRRASKGSSRKSCGKGQILKTGYFMRRGSKRILIKPTCIKKRGSSRRSDVRIPIDDENSLAKYGYVDLKMKSAKQRRIALHKALAHIKPLSLYRRILAIATLSKNTDPKLNILLISDSDWLKGTKEYAIDREKSARKSRSLRSRQSRRSR